VNEAFLVGVFSMGGAGIRIEDCKSGDRMIQPSPYARGSIFQSLRGRLIVSCQASGEDPLNQIDTLRRIAASVLRGGASGLRAEGVENIRAFREITKLPLIGIIKKYDANGEVYITPDFDSARAVSEAGADIVALDCTHRRLNQGEPRPRLIKRIHDELGKPVCADIADIEDAIAAEGNGADAVASTLYGYTVETAGMRSVSWSLIETLVEHMTIPVIVEGHITRPEEVRRAFEIGVNSVVIGSAITSPESITARFVLATEGYLADSSSKQPPHMPFR
jgi:N-acylglucosamine-6-phosphate 2-epimerase